MLDDLSQPRMQTLQKIIESRA